MDREKAFDLELGREAVSERSFLSQVYFWMSMGLVLTGVVAGWMSVNPNLVIGLMRNQGLFWIIVLAQLGIVLWLSMAIGKISRYGYHCLIYSPLEFNFAIANEFT